MQGVLGFNYNISRLGRLLVDILLRSVSSKAKKDHALSHLRRFSDKPLKSADTLSGSRQICALEAKNLHVPKSRRIGTGEETPEIRAALKIFGAWMQKEGYKKNRKYAGNLLTLSI